MNNKPFAAVSDLDDENAQDILLLVSRLRAQMPARSIRNQACKDGMDKTTLKEVNALIKRTRAELKRGKQLYRAQADIGLDSDPMIHKQLTYHR